MSPHHSVHWSQAVTHRPTHQLRSDQPDKAAFEAYTNLQPLREPHLCMRMAMLQAGTRLMLTCQHQRPGHQAGPKAAWTSPKPPTLARSDPRVACQANSREQEPMTAGGVDVSRRHLLNAAGAVVLLQQLQQLEPAWAAQGIEQVFVAGATGNTGRRVVQQLRAKGYLVRAGVRDLKKAQQLGLGLDKGVTLVQADVTKGPQALAEAIGDAQAVISAIGGAGLLLSGAAAVDEQGAINLVEAAKARGVQQFVMVSSLLTNAAAIGEKDNPNYKFLNLFGQVLDHKLVAEKYLRTSGLNYTIVRPGGLSNDPADQVGNLIVRPEDTLLGRDTDPGRRISRDTVAAVCVEALSQDSSRNKVLEIVASPDAPELPVDTWFTI